MPVTNHAVLRQESDVAGTRAYPEVGIFTQTYTSRPPVPWDKLAVGDLVWMKWSGGPIVVAVCLETSWLGARPLPSPNAR